MLRINVIGAGRLGQSLAWLLHHHQLASIQAVVCQTQLSAQHAVANIGTGTPYTLADKLPTADITWLCTTDQQLAPVCEQLVSQQQISHGSIVVHSSGAQSSEILHSARRFTCTVASLHPMKSFAIPGQTTPSLSGVYCGAEGDAAALAVLTPLLTQLGAHVVTVDAQHKALYHAAAVFASNFMPLLYHSATACFDSAQMETEAAHAATLALMQSSLHNLDLTHNASNALTGPVQRGDARVIEQHWQALQAALPSLAPVYASLSAATLALLVEQDVRHAPLHTLLTTLTSDDS